MALTIGFHLLVIGLTILGIMAPVAVAPAEAGFVANLTSPSTYQINQGYLYAEYNATLGSVHHGVDFSCPSGSNVTAAASGTVIVSADLGGSSYGQYMILKHYDSIRGYYYTLYAHLSQRLYSVGQTVTYGTVIAKSGSSGNVTGPHLHFEVRKDTNSYYTVRNPECWLQRSNYDGYGSVYSMCKTSSGTRIEDMRVSGASKPESGYGASYTYHRRADGYEFGDITNYNINYHIARAYPDSDELLTYAKYGFTTKYQTVNIEANISKRVNDMIW